jgi:hypothetical protein
VSKSLLPAHFAGVDHIFADQKNGTRNGAAAESSHSVTGTSIAADCVFLFCFSLMCVTGASVRPCARLVESPKQQNTGNGFWAWISVVVVVVCIVCWEKAVAGAFCPKGGSEGGERGDPVFVCACRSISATQTSCSYSIWCTHALHVTGSASIGLTLSIKKDALVSI